MNSQRVWALQLHSDCNSLWFLFWEFKLDTLRGGNFNAADGIDANKRPAVFRSMMVGALKQNGIPKPIPQTEINSYRRIDVRKQFFTSRVNLYFLHDPWQSLNYARLSRRRYSKRKSPETLRGLEYIITIIVMTLQTPQSVCMPPPILILFYHSIANM
jgi:hypothetical protein